MAEKTKKTAKKKTTTKASTAKSSSSVSASTKNSNSGNNQTILVIILIIAIIQLVLTLAIAIDKDGKKGGHGSDDADLEEMAAKINAIDNFFANNVDGYGEGSPSGSGNAAPSGEPLEVDIEGEPYLGDENAPVIIAEFSDYECPFCARFFSESFNQLKEEYIDTGKVRFVYKDFPLSFHQNALPAAVAANCVHKELGNEKYFEMHDILFENMRSLTASNLKNWALELGATESEYDSCIADPEMTAEANADLAEGGRLGISGTPSFIIDGNLIVGAQPYSVIKAAIEEALNN